MGYNSSAAGSTIPGLKKKKKAKKKKAPKQKKARKKKGKKPCKYGPRDADGYCPKKPSRNPFADDASEEAPAPKARPKKLTKKQKDAERTLKKITDKGADKLVENTFAVLKDPVKAKAAATAIKTIAKMNVGDVAKAGAAGYTLLGGVALAGIAAFAATHYIITRRAANKEAKQQQAYEAALAYRQARADAMAKQGGKPLTAAQQTLLSSAFKKELAKLGLSSDNLKGLR